MHETDTHEEQEMVVVTVPEVKPFSRRPECAKCGSQVSFIGDLLPFGYSFATYQYCPGNLDSKVKVRRFLQPEVEMETSCFGIYEEHLHLRCNRCGYHSLMSTKGK